MEVALAEEAKEEVRADGMEVERAEEWAAAEREAKGGPMSPISLVISVTM